MLAADAPAFAARPSASPWTSQPLPPASPRAKPDFRPRPAAAAARPRMRGRRAGARFPARPRGRGSRRAAVDLIKRRVPARGQHRRAPRPPVAAHRRRGRHRAHRRRRALAARCWRGCGGWRVVADEEALPVRGRLARSRRLRAGAASRQRSAGRAGADPARAEAGRAAAGGAARRRDLDGAAPGLARGGGRDHRRRLAARRPLRRRARSRRRCCSAPASRCPSSIPRW